MVLSELLECGAAFCTDPILKCFNNSEELNSGDLLDSVVPELVSWLTV
jgi:hypothetical protein